VVLACSGRDRDRDVILVACDARASLGLALLMTDLNTIPIALRAVAPTLTDDAIASWTAALLPPMRSAGIVTTHRIAMFLGQCSIESGGFRHLTENLDYTADRIRVVWPPRFPTAASAAAVAHNPQALANTVYANRLGNGSAASGDGWTFRGRGLLQTTGRANYASLAAALRMDVHDLLPWLETPAGAAQSATYYWTSRGLNRCADAWDVSTCTRLISGSTSGLAERVGACGRALAALVDVGMVPAEVAEPTADDLNAAELNRIKGA